MSLISVASVFVFSVAGCWFHCPAGSCWLGSFVSPQAQKSFEEFLFINNLLF